MRFPWPVVWAPQPSGPVRATMMSSPCGRLSGCPGWSQAELADKLLCSDSLVSGVKTMNKTPTLDFAKRADQAFDLPGTFVVLHELVSREAWPSYFAPVIDFETRCHCRRGSR